MRTYLVGGAVRDFILGENPQDNDYVVLDTTPEQLRSQGFLEVGSDFKVYLHPLTHQEYAFPRGSSIEEDLARRDLTINAMAMDEAGNIIDPLGGRSDLQKKILRHVSGFTEDPLRLLRVARFKAKYPDFSVAAETMAVMKTLSHQDILAKIPAERILRELSLALEARSPVEFIQVLKAAGALQLLFPEWMPETVMMDLERVAQGTTDIRLRFGSLFLELGPMESKNLCSRLKVSSEWEEVARCLGQGRGVWSQKTVDPSQLLDLFYAIDAFRKPELVTLLSEAAQIFTGKGDLIKDSFQTVGEVSVKDLAPGLVGKQIGIEIKKLRLQRLSSWMKQHQIN